MSVDQNVGRSKSVREMYVQLEVLVVCFTIFSIHITAAGAA